MAGRLSGKVALVTGAGNGIGQACALALGAEGARVVVNDLGTSEFAEGESRGAADGTVERLTAAGGEAVASYDSVATSAGCEAAVALAVGRFGRLDVVVGCAGAILPADLATDDAGWYRFMDLYLAQKFWLARAAVPAMVERGWGRLVFTTSHGALGTLGNPIFASAMGGVISLAKAIAHEHRDRGVTVNCLAPGATTRLAEVTLPAFEEQHRLGVLDDAEWASIQAGPGPASHVAPIVAWLCSPAADGVTGEVFHAAGGLVGRWSAYEEPRSIYRGDHRAVGPWTLDELDQLVPGQLLT
jgi:NAD(P)-dependent dehydrogenase (short-subunit alcohol dehydrogenase family)